MKTTPFQEAVIKESLQIAFSAINDQQNFVIRVRFGIEQPAWSETETADTLKVTKDRVRQIELEALKKMRHRLCCSCDPHCPLQKIRRASKFTAFLSNNTQQHKE